jgi:hypothetical protein
LPCRTKIFYRGLQNCIKPLSLKDGYRISATIKSGSNIPTFPIKTRLRQDWIAALRSQRQPRQMSVLIDEHSLFPYIASCLNNASLRGFAMPTISMFYGIVICLYFYDDERHKLPHINPDCPLAILGE